MRQNFFYSGDFVKQKLSFMTVLLIALFSFSQAQAAEQTSKNYGGKVGRLILDAMKSSGIKSACNKEGLCKSAITDFFTAEEGDGCGGGTTSFDTRYTNLDKSKYDYSACTGEDNNRVAPDKAKALVSILTDLDYSKSEGWASIIEISKIECSTDKRNTYVSCEVVQ